MLSFEDLSFSYGNHQVFNRVYFQLPEHGLVAVVGRNGIGKTTLLRILGGLYKASFTVSQKLSATYIDIEFLTLDMLSVKETIHLLKCQGNKFNTQMLNNNPLIDQQMLTTRVGALSLGQRQRLILAISAAFTKPNLILLDEPFNGLDFESAINAKAQLQIASKHKTILFATHNHHDISNLATHILKIVSPSQILLSDNINDGE